ncbi:hypothetical protein ACMFMF_009409 [Clarireedia jacksonii]
MYMLKRNDTTRPAKIRSDQMDGRLEIGVDENIREEEEEPGIEDDWPGPGPKSSGFIFIYSVLRYFGFSRTIENALDLNSDSKSNGDGCGCGCGYGDTSTASGFLCRGLRWIFALLFAARTERLEEAGVDEYSDGNDTPGFLSRMLRYLLSFIFSTKIDSTQDASFDEYGDDAETETTGFVSRISSYVFAFLFPAKTTDSSHDSNAEISNLDIEPDICISDPEDNPSPAISTTPSSFLSPSSSPSFTSTSTSTSSPPYLPPQTLTLHLSIFSASKFSLHSNSPLKPQSNLPSKYPYWMTVYHHIPLSTTISQLKRILVADAEFPLMRAGGDRERGTKGLKIRVGGRWARHGGRGLGEVVCGKGRKEWVAVGVVVLGGEKKGVNEMEKEREENGKGKIRKKDIPDELVEEIDGVIGARPGWPFRGEVRTPVDSREWVMNLKETEFAHWI